jgi:hypothetical protein
MNCLKLAASLQRLGVRQSSGAFGVGPESGRRRRAEAALWRPAKAGGLPQSKTWRSFPSPLRISGRGIEERLMGSENLRRSDANRRHEPIAIPLNRPPGTFSPSGGEGWDEGRRHEPVVQAGRVSPLRAVCPMPSPGAHGVTRPTLGLMAGALPGSN